MSLLPRLGPAAAVVLLTAAVWQWAQGADETERLDAIATRVFRPGMSPGQKLQAAYDAVAGRVRHVPLHHPVRDRVRREGRPFLRWSAWETWSLRFGFCGESSRLTVVLLQLGGMAARRYTLYRGTRAVHVVPAALVGGNWLWVDPDLRLLPPRDFGQWVSMGEMPAFTGSPSGLRLRRLLGRIDTVRPHPGPSWIQDALATAAPDAELRVLERPHDLWAVMLALAALPVATAWSICRWVRRALRRRGGTKK